MDWLVGIANKLFFQQESLIMSNVKKDIPTHKITVATNDKPVILFIWHNLGQLKTMLNEISNVGGKLNIDFPLNKKFPDVQTYATDNGTFYVAVKCGSFKKFASLDDIRMALESINTMSDYRLGKTMHTIKQSMKKYAFQHLETNVAQLLTH